MSCVIGLNQFFSLKLLYGFWWKNIGSLNDEVLHRFLNVKNFMLSAYWTGILLHTKSYENGNYLACTCLNPS